MRTSNKWLAVIIALQILTLIGQWVAPPGGASPALAQVPDAGAQRLQVIEEIKSTNDKLDKLLTLLSNGNLQVKVAKSDESKGQ